MTPDLYDDPDAFLTPKDIARILKLHIDTVNGILRRGEIRSAMHGNRGGRGERRVLRSDFEAYVAEKHGIKSAAESGVPL